MHRGHFSCIIPGPEGLQRGADQWRNVFRDDPRPQVVRVRQLWRKQIFVQILATPVNIAKPEYRLPAVTLARPSQILRRNGPRQE